jgi:hypothetical protein
MASTGREREKFKVSKTPLKWHDLDEHIARFLMAQTTHETELRIHRYSWSKFGQPSPVSRDESTSVLLT